MSRRTIYTGILELEAMRNDDPDHPQCPRGGEFGRKSVAKPLDRAGYRRRSLRKELITGHIDLHERDQQFRHIDTLRWQARVRGVPVLCVDTKKLARSGWTILRHDSVHRAA